MKKILIVLIIGIMLITTGCSEEPFSQGTYELKALNISSSEEGSWFMLGGSWEEETFFSFYIKRNRGAISLKKIEARKCVIYEDIFEDMTPYVIESYHLYGEGENSKWELHIPPNSITTDFEIGLENIK